MTDLNDLLYMRARYYIPSIGRFTQYDPIEAINPYIYADNNPMKWIDPSGNQVAVGYPMLIITIIVAAYLIQQYTSNNRGICMFSKGKKDPRWDAPGMPGDRIRQYEQSQPGNFEPPPNFPKKGGWWTKVVWAISKIAEAFSKDQINDKN